MDSELSRLVEDITVVRRDVDSDAVLQVSKDIMNNVSEKCVCLIVAEDSPELEVTVLRNSSEENVLKVTEKMPSLVRKKFVLRNVLEVTQDIMEHNVSKNIVSGDVLANMSVKENIVYVGTNTPNVTVVTIFKEVAVSRKLVFANVLEDTELADTTVSNVSKQQPVLVDGSDKDTTVSNAGESILVLKDIVAVKVIVKPRNTSGGVLKVTSEVNITVLRGEDPGDVQKVTGEEDIIVSGEKNTEGVLKDPIMTEEEKTVSRRLLYQDVHVVGNLVKDTVTNSNLSENVHVSTPDAVTNVSGESENHVVEEDGVELENTVKRSENSTLVLKDTKAMELTVSERSEPEDVLEDTAEEVTPKFASVVPPFLNVLEVIVSEERSAGRERLSEDVLEDTNLNVMLVSNTRQFQLVLNFTLEEVTLASYVEEFHVVQKALSERVHNVLRGKLFVNVLEA